MKPVRIALIGCGVIGQYHAEAAAQSDLIDLSAVVDVREDVAKATADKFGADKTYADANQALTDAEIEAVVLAMPAAYRGRLALDAFAAGKHVLLEKPVAANADEGKAVEIS